MGRKAGPIKYTKKEMNYAKAIQKETGKKQVGMDGNIYPLYIDTKNPIPINQWMKANKGFYFKDSKGIKRQPAETGNYQPIPDKKTAEAIEKAGYKVIITSDSCLTGTDRVAEASYEINADIFINVQGDEPMIDPNDIKKVINLKQDNPDHVINCMSKLHKDEDASDKKIPKIICDLDKNLIYSSRNSLPGSKESQVNNIMKQVCIYVFSKKQLHQFHDNIKTPLESHEDI